MPRVSKTSGQGVSRKGYQGAYALGQKGTGAPGKGALRDVGPQVSSTRSYSKSSEEPAFKMNVDYDAGDALGISNLADVKGFLGKGKPPRGLNLSPRKTAKLK